MRSGLLLTWWLAACSVSVGRSSPPEAATPAPAAETKAPFCSNVEGQRYCFDSAERQRVFDAGMVEETERKRRLLDEKAADEARHKAQVETARAEFDQRNAEHDEAQRVQRERLAQLQELATKKAYAVLAISALICSLEGGDNREWVRPWQDVLRERYAAKRMPCTSVQAIRACHDDPSTCTDESRDAGDLWRLAERDLWGAGPRADAPLRCCDGEMSPSCTCGGPRRGCCSYHGGVCGCSAD